MKRFGFIPVLAALALAVLTMYLQGSNPASFLSPTAGLICFGLSFAIMLVLFSPADMRRAWRVVSMKQPASQEEVRVALAFFVTMRSVFLAVGPFGLIVGLVRVLEHLGGGSMQALGEGLAVALDTMLYGLAGVIFLAVPGIGAAKKKLAMLGAES